MSNVLTQSKTSKQTALSKCFADLRKKYIFAKQNYSCCMGCGTCELQQEHDALPENKRPIGYVFFHGQDNESRVDGRDFHLRFGAFDGDEPNEHVGVVIGNLVCRSLKKFGIEYEWNGSKFEAIKITKEPDRIRPLTRKQKGFRW